MTLTVPMCRSDPGMFPPIRACRSLASSPGRYRRWNLELLRFQLRPPAARRRPAVLDEPCRTLGHGHADRRDLIQPCSLHSRMAAASCKTEIAIPEASGPLAVVPLSLTLSWLQRPDESLRIRFVPAANTGQDSRS
jgi:hypothetical protein